MYDKHHVVEEEAYKMLRELVGMNMSPALINRMAEIRTDLNKRYKDEYHVEFTPITDPITHFTIRVKVHTVH